MTTDKDRCENPGAVLARDHGGFTIDKPEAPEAKKDEGEELEPARLVGPERARALRVFGGTKA